MAEPRSAASARPRHPLTELVGTPLELQRNPVNTFVVSFLASQRMNFLDVTPMLTGS